MPERAKTAAALAANAASAGRYLAQTLRLMVGVPDYEAYRAHIAAAHPDATPMTYEQFFRERQAARYGGKIGRCC